MTYGEPSARRRKGNYGVAETKQIGNWSPANPAAVRRAFPRTAEEGRYMEDLMIFAARRCRTTKPHHELWDEVLGYSDEKRANFLGRVVNEEWAIDVLEIGHLAFDFEQIPLWLVVEMLRHRLLFRDFSVEQLSQRAIDPMKLQVQAPTAEMQTLVDDYMAELKRELAEGRIPPENLREVVPQGVLVNLVMAGNCRAWQHNFFMRCSKELGGKGGAHPKFMAIADSALRQAREVYPLAFREIIPA